MSGLIFPELWKMCGLQKASMSKELVPIGGLTKRELFAAIILQGNIPVDTMGGRSYEDFAYRAVRTADALLAELKREE